MEIKAAPKKGGSFGIPFEISEKKAQIDKEQAEKLVEKEHDDVEEVKPEVRDNASSSDEDIVQDLLKELSVDFTDQDFQKLVFAGYVEKKVNVITHKNPEFCINATIKTLTTGEYELVDEIVMEDVKNTPMSEQSLRSRTSLLVISFAVLKLNDKPLIRDTKGIDPKAVAKQKRDIFKGMSPVVINKLITKHTALTQLTNFIIRVPGERIKNS